MIKEIFKFEISYFYLLLLTIIFTFLTTPNFSLEETLNFGGRDGLDYYNISKEAPEIFTKIQYIKAERFFFPYLIGITSKIFNLDIFQFYKILSISLCLSLILLTNRLLILLNIIQKIRFISLLLIILNPYIFRYYIAVPTLINDIIFLNISIILCIGLISNKTSLIFISIFIGSLCRQNIIAFVISIYVIFFFEIFFNSKKKFFTINLIFIITLLFVTAQLINYNYAQQSQSPVSAQELYYVTIFGIFSDNYNFKQFMKFIFFPFLSFGPLIAILLISKIKLDDKNFILLSFLILSSVMLIAQPFLGGPIITGKNFTRLANYCYPLCIIIICLISNKEKIKKLLNKNSFILFYFSLFIWSLHPTFSKIKIFSFLKFII